VYRNGQREWGGYLNHVGVATPRPGVEITLHGDGYYSRLRQRLVMSDLVYSALNQTTIAWNLIAHTQAQTSGGLGFTNGTHHGNVVQRTRDYCAMDRPVISSGIDELAQQLDGFDFEVDENGAFNTWNPRKQIPSTVNFTGSNAIEASYDIDSGDLASMVVYQGDDDCNPPFGSVSDSSGLTTYGLVQSSLDTGTESWAESKNFANTLLFLNRAPRWQVQLTWSSENALAPAWEDITLGSLVRFTAVRGFATFTQKLLRVVNIGATFEPGLAPRYSASLDDAVEDL
jgi:hypothetical protein